MGKRRFAQVSTSDEEEEDDVPPKQKQSSQENSSKKRKGKQMKLPEDEEQEVEEEERSKKKKRKSKEEKEEEDYEEDEDYGHDDEASQSEEEEEQPADDAKPLGEPIGQSTKGRSKRTHYKSFEFDGNRYELEDPVLLIPEDKHQKPYVAIIKDITVNKSGSVMVTGQWFYRPEEAERKGGGHWQSRDTRELFYSFHRDDVPAESVMHKCVVHFVPLHKQLPKRKQHPGFIVQKVYDTVEQKLWKLTDKDYEDKKQGEIDILVNKTMQRLGDLPDLDAKENNAGLEDQLKAKRSLRRKNITPLDVHKEEEAGMRSDPNPKSETPGSCPSNSSEYYCILANFKVLTGESHRDKCLEKLLQSIQYVCSSANSTAIDEKEKVASGGDGNCQGNANESHENSAKRNKSFVWPDDAVPAVVALEKASHESLSSDSQKYNQKMRQLLFNFKANAVLAQRLINGELEPSKILSMSPNELKEGITAEESAKKEPDDLEHMQMTDARCSRCSEFKVGLRDIIHAGHGDRYQLECIACGYSWYASRDEVSTLTIDDPSSNKNVGTAPWATAKFEDVEKKLVSPRDTDKPSSDTFKKTSEAYMPVLDAQRSFGKSRKEDKSERTRSAE